MKVRCSRCSEEHDLEHMEPSFGLPDLAFELPPKVREKRVRASNDFCQVLMNSGHARCFLRALLQFSVAGRLRPCRWGIWVEVNKLVFDQVMDLWEDPERCSAPAMAGAIANALPGYPGSLGLKGTVSFANLTHVTYFTLDAADHPLVTDQQNGVPAERAVEWLVNIAHA